MKIIMIFFLLWIICIFSCKSPNKIQWSQKVLTVEQDSISTTVIQRDNTVDSVRYKKSTHYEQKSPRTVQGKWYLVAAILIGVAAIFLLRN